MRDSSRRQLYRNTLMAEFAQAFRSDPNTSDAVQQYFLWKFGISITRFLCNTSKCAYKQGDGNIAIHIQCVCILFKSTKMQKSLGNFEVIETQL